ncbi:NYN domain-containing protein [Meiothermus granaticius]|uniref:NYN domain protein n=1 Tax=Meiothermus granaticius NBRC 107808 TaxID=1227551 RepID=A0A399F842_9DEIN|nr:NYN domain-containing protein [Meiothermus granaticius]MCL6527775.1 NYN domain-containing protein [Thermaceae bacterium]RIH91895.1 NYN domain protein [Meiothermus granaticius NBRC 107808]GEM85485.1 NYN domain-containing protein [Meiothermus granaticius NBRC 107808]
MPDPLSHVPGWSPAQRVGLFVDTQNLYHSARDYYGQNVNFESLMRYAVGGRQLVRATAYVVERENDTSAWPFIYKLSTIGFRVRRMNLTLKETTDEGKPIYEGNWDMGIAADMVRLMHALDVVVLGSGDGDFVDIIEVLMERGIRVEVIAFKETTSQKLVDAVDRFVHLPEIENAFVPTRDRSLMPKAENPSP